MSTSSDSSPSSSKVKIIIVGAGVCGLLTAIHLERAGMDYIVVEKARTLSPLGSALSFTSATSYIFDQLGYVLCPCDPFYALVLALSLLCSSSAQSYTHFLGWSLLFLC